MNLRTTLARLWRSPSVIVAEIAWRWAFAGSAIAFLLFALVRLQHAITVLPEQEEMLHSRNPLQIAEALLQLWVRARPLVVRLGSILIPATIILWIIAVTVGRAYVLNRLSAGAPRPNWASLAILNALRAFNFLLLVLAYVACSRATALVSTAEHPNYSLGLLLFLGLFAIALTLWSAINWLLSVACIYAAQGFSLAGSMRNAVELQQDSGGRLARISAQNAGLRTIVAILFTVIALFPLVLYRATLVFWTMELLLSVIYCATSDVLLLARLAGYVEVIEERTVPNRTG